MNNLKKFRELNEMSQRDLAEKSGVNIRMIQGYEQGTKDLSKASVATAQQLAVALNCSIEKLVGWSNVIEDIQEDAIKIFQMTQEHHLPLKKNLDCIKERYKDYDKVIDLDKLIWNTLENYNRERVYGND